MTPTGNMIIDKAARLLEANGYTVTPPAATPGPCAWCGLPIWAHGQTHGPNYAGPTACDAYLDHSTVPARPATDPEDCEQIGFGKVRATEWYWYPDTARWCYAGYDPAAEAPLRWRARRRKEAAATPPKSDDTPAEKPVTDHEAMVAVCRVVDEVVDAALCAPERRDMETVHRYVREQEGK